MDQPGPGARTGGPAVVALGGGHGLSASLAALRQVTDRLTAVVTVADDGGSSGRLRRDLDVLPPGDLRMALAALCGEDEWGRTWSEVLQHRFRGRGEVGTTSDAPSGGAGEGLQGHALGNLLIVALWERLGDTVEGLDWVGRLLGARGRVLPMAAVPLDIVAEVEAAGPPGRGAVTTVRGQVEVATTRQRVRSVALDPADPPARPEVVAAVEAADALVLGPGSWFTSVLPHLLVPELARAVERSAARRVVVLNLAAESGETRGFTGADHLDALAAHAPGLRVDAVLADASTVAQEGSPADLERAAGRLGARLVLADVALGDGTPRHDPVRLARAYAALLGEPVPVPPAAPDAAAPPPAPPHAPGGTHAWR